MQTALKYRNRLKEKCDSIRAKFGNTVELFEPVDDQVYIDFEKMPEAHQKSVFQILDFMEELVDVANEKKIDPVRDQQLTWYALRKLGLKIPSELFSVLESGDSVEVYTEDVVQIYRNFRFFEYCSYSIEELMTYPYYNLFERPAWLLDSIKQDIERCFQAKGSPVDVRSPAHFCTETRSRRKNLAHVVLKKMCALDMESTPRIFIVSSALALAPKQTDVVSSPTDL